MRKIFQLAPVIAFTALLAAACGGGGGGPVTAKNPGGETGGTGDSIQLNGAGATFPYPIYSKWFSEYNKLHPNVRINYQSIGSGGGIRQLLARTVFFGASDQPMTDEMLAKATRPVLHLPTVLGAVVPVYNIEGASAPLKFTGAVLADMFMGKIKRWNDPAIVKLNAGVKLPPTDITFVHRSDGSGTTFIFADYLGKISPEFKSKVGADASLRWPVGIGGKGNEGVSGMVTQAPGSLGYVELVYALQNKITVGSVQNSTGAFVVPSVSSVTAAAAGAAANMPPDFRVSITNAPGADAYPIASFTWILLYEDPPEKAQARTMRDFMRWALTDGQKMAPELGYANLPQQVIDLELKALEQLKVQ